MNPAANQPSSGAPLEGSTGASTTQGGTGGDFLDKGVNMLANKSGHQQKPGTVEKVSPLSAV